MTTIYKYQFSTSDILITELPKGAKVLTVQMQSGTPCIWCMVNTDNPTEKRVFHVYGTGHPIKITEPSSLNYIGTYQELNGALVWHLFELEVPF